MINIKEIMRFLEQAADYYEKSAPTVNIWIDDCYRRLSIDLKDVTLFEICQLLALKENDTWEQANYAANRCYKVNERLGKDTTGLIGF